jgi:hypothetical protein
MALLSDSQNAWLCLAGIDCHASKWLGREVEHSFFTKGKAFNDPGHSPLAFIGKVFVLQYL